MKWKTWKTISEFLGWGTAVYFCGLAAWFVIAEGTIMAPVLLYGYGIVLGIKSATLAWAMANIMRESQLALLEVNEATDPILFGELLQVPTRVAQKMIAAAIKEQEKLRAEEEKENQARYNFNRLAFHGFLS